MKKGLLRPAALAGLCSLLGLGAGIVRADVTIDRTTSVEGAGAMAFANMSGTSRTVISGDKARTDSDMKMQSKIIGFLARNAVGPSADIIALGDDKMYHLNMAKKEYTETTFEQMQAQMQKMSDQMSQSGENKQSPSAVDQSKCEWLPAKVSVNRSGEKAQFAGYDAERVTITAIQPCQDKDSGSICDVAIVMDQWMSSGLTENSETRNFYSAYAAKMGLDAASVQQDASQRAKAMFSQYKGVWTEVASKMQGMKGYPVRSSFTLALGGPQCKDPKAQQSQSQSSQSSQSDDSSNSGDIASAMASKLGGLFHKKKDDSDTPAAAPGPIVPPAPVPPGEVPLMTVSSQLVAISTTSVSAGVFAVPPDFKKVEMKQ